ncbi:MAG: hypothetical protein ABWY08_16785 [Comamonas sp.]
MFGIQRAAPSVIDFGGLMDTAQAVALRGGKLRSAPVQQPDMHRHGLLGISASDINQATRSAFQAALEIYLGTEGAAHALRLGGADSDNTHPLMAAEIRQVLDAAHRIKKFSGEISQLKKTYIEQLIARNAEDSKIVLRALDHGLSRDQMQLSSVAQARVDEAKRQLDAKCAEWNGYLQNHRAPACAL